MLQHGFCLGPKLEFNNVELDQTCAEKNMVWQKVSIKSTGGSYNKPAIPGASSTRLYYEQLNPAQLIES